MSIQDYIVSLDIGTSKIRVMMGQVQNNTVQMIGVGSADAHGIKKGTIVDIDLAVESIRKAIEQAEQMVDIEIRELYVGICGNHIELYNSQGVVAVSNEEHEVGEADIERVTQACKVMALPPDREIVDIVPRQYIVDGMDGIRDPRGMIGVRLEMEATVITGSKTWMNNLKRCIERAGVRVAGYLLTPLAAGEVALSHDEKTLGVILIDLGAGTSSIALFQDGFLQETSVLPIGGDYITNDISIGLRTSTEMAEKIKMAYGQALISEAQEEVTFQVPLISGGQEQKVNQVELAEIIEPRVQEIFSLIAHEVQRISPKEPAAGFVLVGGVVNMPGVLEIAQQVLGQPVRVAKPDFVGLRDPSYINGSGMVQYIARRYHRHFGSAPAAVQKARFKKAPKRQRRAFERVKNWLSEFI